MSIFQTDGDGGLAFMPPDPTGLNGSDQYEHPDTAQLGPAGTPTLYASGADMIRNATPDPSLNAVSGTPGNVSTTPASSQTSTPPSSAQTTAAAPTFMQRMQNVAGLPTTPMSWQQRVQALAGQAARHGQQPGSAAPAPAPASLSPQTPRSSMALQQPFPRSAARLRHDRRPRAATGPIAAAAPWRRVFWRRWVHATRGRRRPDPGAGFGVRRLRSATLGARRDRPAFVGHFNT